MRSVRSKSFATTGSFSRARNTTSPCRWAFHSLSFIGRSLFLSIGTYPTKRRYADIKSIQRFGRGCKGVLKMLHLSADSGYKLSIDKSPVYSIIYINKCADGKKYHTIPTVQRAAVWCKAVSVSCGKSSRSSLPNGCKTLVSSAGCSRYRAGLCWKPVRGCAQHANESGTAESLMLQGLCLLKEAGDKGFFFFFFKSSP